MFCVEFIWMLFVPVLFGVFNEGVSIQEPLVTTDMDISSSEAGPSARSLYEKEVESIPAGTDNIFSQLHGERRNEFSNEPETTEKSKVLSSELWSSSGSNSEELSEPPYDSDDAAEMDAILRDTNNIPRSFKKANLIEMADDTVSYADIVYIGPANYNLETANVNMLSTRRERETETTQSRKDDIFDVDRSRLTNNMNNMGLDVNKVSNIGNKVIFRFQLQMEYNTDDIPPDIKTDGILENPKLKGSPAEEVEGEIKKQTSVDNIREIMLGMNGEIDRKPSKENQLNQLNRYNRKSKYNSNKNVELKSTVEYSTEYAISPRNMHNEEISSDVEATTNTKNIPDESPEIIRKNIAMKMFPRSSFADDYTSVSIEKAADVSAAATDEVNTNESSTIDPVTETTTPQHTGNRGSISRDITVGDIPRNGDVQALMEKRLQRFMFMEMGLGVVIIISSVTTVIQIMVLVKKFRGIRNKYECTAVP